MFYCYKKFIFIFFSYCIFLSTYAMENRAKLANSVNNQLKRAIKIAQQNNFSPEDWKDIENLIKNGADSNITLGFTQTPLLMKAIQDKNYATAKFLLEHQADPYAGDEFDRTSFQAILQKQKNSSVQDEDVQMFKALLEFGKQLHKEKHLEKINGEIVNSSCQTLLALTVKKKLSPLTQLLINYGADITLQNNITTPQGVKSLLEQAIVNDDPDTTKILCNAKVPLTNISKRYNAYHLAADKSEKLIETLMTHGYIDLRETKNKQTEKKIESWKSWTPKKWDGRKPSAPIQQTIWGTLLAFNHTDNKDKKPQPSELSYLPKNVQNHIFSKLASEKDFHWGLFKMLAGLKIYDYIVLPILNNKHVGRINNMLQDANNVVQLTPSEILKHKKPKNIIPLQILLDGTKINEDAKVFNDAFSQNGDSTTTEKILESIPEDNLCRQIAEIHYLSLPTNK